MPPNFEAATAVTCTSAALPTAGGDGAVETDTDRLERVSEVQADITQADPISTKCLSKKEKKKPDERFRLLKKLTYKLKESSDWPEFQSPEEKQQFSTIAEAISEENVGVQKIPIEEYETMVEEVKQLEKKYRLRANEHMNLAVSLESLDNSIANLDDLQTELHKPEIARAAVLTKLVKEQQKMELFKDPIIFCSALDKLILKIETPRVIPAEAFPSTPIEDFIFHAERNNFPAFIGQLRNRFIDNAQYGKIEDSFMLPYQNVDGQPPKWLRVRLVGRGFHWVIVFIRSDNGYLVCFENRNGRFELGPGGRSRLARFIPGSQFVDVDIDYPSLMNFERSEDDLEPEELRRRMKAVRIDGTAMLDYIDTLSNFELPLPDAEIEAFQTAVTGITVMLPEVSRIIQLFNTVVEGWRSRTLLNDLLLQYMWCWTDISAVYRQWKRSKGKVFSPKLQGLVNLVSGADAGFVLFLVLNIKLGQRNDDDGKDEPDFPGDGGNGGPKELGDDADKRTIAHQPPHGNSRQQPHQGCPGDGVNESGTSQKPTQGNSEHTLQGSAAPTSNSKHQEPLVRPDDATDVEGATLISSSSTRSWKRYSVPSPSLGLIDIVSSHKPMKAYLGWSKLSDQSLEIHEPSRGLADLVAPKKKIMALHIRKHDANPLEDPSQPCIERLGQFLVEIFDISSNFPFVGTVMICDEYSIKTICHKEDWNTTYDDFTSKRDTWVSSGNAAVEFKDKLELIGPSRATTANGAFIIKVVIPGTRMKARDISRLTCDAADFNKVKTYCLKTGRGCLFVTCCVFPEAVQAFIELRLQLKRRYERNAKIYGCVTAYIGKFQIGSTLFEKDCKEAVPLAVPLYPKDSDSKYRGYTPVRVPLTRSHLAVPLGELVHIKGRLHVCGYDDITISIDQTLPVQERRVETAWSRIGESLSSVRIWPSGIF